MAVVKDKLFISYATEFNGQRIAKLVMTTNLSEWQHFSFPDDSTCCDALFSFNGQLHAALDHGSSDHFRLYRLPDMDRGAWIPLPAGEFRLKQWVFAYVVHEGKLWVMGGWDGKKYLNSIEVYDLGTNKWSGKGQHGSLPVAVYAGQAVLCNGCIYLVGGLQPDRTPNVGVFVSEGGIWKRSRSPAETPHGNCGGGSFLSSIIVAGGGPARSKTGKVYLPGKDDGTWLQLPTLSAKRSRPRLICYKNMLVCIGGIDNVGKSSSAIEVMYLH